MILFELCFDFRSEPFQFTLRSVLVIYFEPFPMNIPKSLGVVFLREKIGLLILWGGQCSNVGSFMNFVPQINRNGKLTP